MDTLFRWIHLSDIHVGHGDTAYGWDQQLVLKEIVADIARLRSADPDPPIDAVLVTGDIANTGAGRRASEYDDAAKWLAEVGAAAGVEASRIFVVPGNHDVDRGVDKDPAVKALITAVREGSRSLDDALADAGERAMIARRLEHYLAFAAAFAPIDAADRLFWVHRLVARSGLAVRLVGLNTTMLAAGDGDLGKLRVGMTQIGKAFADPASDELVLALGHHPLGGGWLFDQTTLEPWLKKHAHALLTGHVHVADAEESRGGSGQALLRIVAGSAHGDAMPPGIPAGHGYNLGAVVRGADGQARIRVTPRKWSAKNAEFRPDVDNVPEGQQFSDHPLEPAIALPAAIAPARAPRPASPGLKIVPGETVPVFISGAPEDDGLRLELQKHLVQLRRTKKASFKSSQEVPAGVDRAEWLSASLEEARIILLLISKDYIAADDYYEDQLLRAVERHDRGEARVIPILLRPYRVSGEPFAKLEMLPRNAVARSAGESDAPKAVGYPVDRDPEGVDAALARVAEEVRKVVIAIRGEPGSGA